MSVEDARRTPYTKSVFFWSESLWEKPAAVQFYRDHRRMAKKVLVPFRGAVNGVSLALYPLSQAIGLVIFPILALITKDKTYLKTSALNSLVGLSMYGAFVGVVALAIMWGHYHLYPIAITIPAASLSGYLSIGGILEGITKQKKLVKASRNESFS